MRPISGSDAGILFPHDPLMPASQRAMLDATPDCVKILSVDGHILMMNKAGCLALNIAQDSAPGMIWLSLLPEEVRPLGALALDKAAGGENARFPGRSMSPDGTAYWDNLLIPIVDDAGETRSIICVSRNETEKILAERKLEEAINREKLLAREMQHRIKNIFSVISGLVVMSDKEAKQSGVPENATAILQEKIGALSRASDAIFANGDLGDASTSTVDLETILRAVLKPYASRCAMAGCAVAVLSDTLTTFALVMHELATNSVKYGALSGASGSVAVDWTLDGNRHLELMWIEMGGPAMESTARRSGFGSEMLDRVIRAAGGTIRRDWRDEGLAVTLHMPVLAVD